MRILTLLTCFLLIFGCSSKNDKDEKSTSSNSVESQPAKLEPIEPAIPDPIPSEKKPVILDNADITEAGVDFKINLPKGYMLSNEKNFEGVRVSANEGRFIMDIYTTNLNYQGIRDYWKSNPEGYTFRKWIINNEDGLLIEMERDGKAEFHMDYLFEWEGKTYRLVSALDKSFSQYDAAQMFNVGRTVKVLNQ